MVIQMAKQKRLFLGVLADEDVQSASTSTKAIKQTNSNTERTNSNTKWSRGTLFFTVFCVIFFGYFCQGDRDDRQRYLEEMQRDREDGQRYREEMQRYFEVQEEKIQRYPEEMQRYFEIQEEKMQRYFEDQEEKNEKIQKQLGTRLEQQKS